MHDLLGKVFVARQRAKVIKNCTVSISFMQRRSSCLLMSRFRLGEALRCVCLLQEYHHHYSTFSKVAIPRLLGTIA